MSKTHITCLACHGSGYVVTRGYSGYPQPIRCGACQGTGTQQVRV